MSLKLQAAGTLLSLVFGGGAQHRRRSRVGGRQPGRALVLYFLRERNRGSGKVENLLLVFRFSAALVVGAVGTVEIPAGISTVCIRAFP